MTDSTADDDEADETQRTVRCTRCDRPSKPLRWSIGDEEKAFLAANAVCPDCRPREGERAGSNVEPES